MFRLRGDKKPRHLLRGAHYKAAVEVGAFEARRDARIGKDVFRHVVVQSCSPRCVGVIHGLGRIGDRHQRPELILTAFLILLSAIVRKAAPLVSEAPAQSDPGIFSDCKIALSIGRGRIRYLMSMIKKLKGGPIARPRPRWNPESTELVEVEKKLQGLILSEALV